MTRRLILGGGVALVSLVAGSAWSTLTFAQAQQGAWVCPAPEKAKKNSGFIPLTSTCRIICSLPMPAVKCGK